MVFYDCSQPVCFLYQYASGVLFLWRWHNVWNTEIHCPRLADVIGTPTFKMGKLFISKILTCKTSEN